MADFEKQLEHELEESVDSRSIGSFEPIFRRFQNGELGYRADWWSRNHRKNRHPELSPLGNYKKPAEQVGSKPGIRFWGWEWWNLSWWVAQLFFWGSVVWTVNGVLAMWPLQDSELQLEFMGWTAFTGGLIFIFGGYSAFLEVFNQHRKVKLGHIFKFAEDEGLYLIEPLKGNTEAEFLRKKLKEDGNNWRLWTYQKKNWGWWLNFLQVLGALIFFTACVSGIPELFPETNFWKNAVYWMPQMLGAVFFVIASWMSMREVQFNLFSFPIGKIAWQVGLWNLVGAIGFFLCGYFGMMTETAALKSSELNYWGSAFSTFWGSIAFLISSYLMLVEILNRHSIKK